MTTEAALSGVSAEHQVDSKDAGRETPRAESSSRQAEPQPTAPQLEDVMLQAKFGELRKDLDSVAKDIAAHVVQAPYEVLCDCYCADFAMATVKKLQARRADIMGQVERARAEQRSLGAAAAQARKEAAVSRAELERLRARYDAVRGEKEVYIADLEVILNDVAVARAELTAAKAENAALRSQGQVE